MHNIVRDGAGRQHGIEKTILAVGACMALMGGSAVADEQENYAVGFSSNHVFDGAIQGENLDVMTGNVSISIPLGPRFPLNEWFGYQLVLYHNSKIWEHDCDLDPNSQCEGELVGPDTYGQGFSLHFGRVYQHPRDDAHIWRYQTPDGADHIFCYDPDGAACLQGADNNRFYTFDTASIYVDKTTEGWSAYPGDGTKIDLTHQVPGDRAKGTGWYATRIETLAERSLDQPEAWVNINYATAPKTPKIDTIEDSVGRLIDLTYSGNLVDIAFPAFGTSVPAVYQLELETRTLHDPSADSSIAPQRSILRRIYLPMLSSADEYYEFDYAPQSAQQNEYGYVTMWRLPTRAKVHYYYTHYKSSDKRPYHSSLNYKEMKVIEQGELKTYRWSYNRIGDGVLRTLDDWVASLLGEINIARTNPTQVRVLDPFDNLTVYYFHATLIEVDDCDDFGCNGNWDDGLLYKVEMYAGPYIDAGRLVKVENYTYKYDRTVLLKLGSDKPDANHTPVNSRQSEVETVTPGSGMYPTKNHRVEYHDWTPGEIKRAQTVREYDGLQLYRETFRDLAPTRDYHGYHTHSLVKDAAGRVLSRTDVAFDYNRLTCKARRAQPGGGPTTSCVDPLSTGDLATSNTYAPGANPEDLEIEAVREGGDDGGSSTTHKTYYGGAVKTKYYDPFPWKAVDRTIDLDTGLVSVSKDPAGAQTSYDWDGLGRLTLISPSTPNSTPEKPIEVSYPNIKQTEVRQVIDSGNFTKSIYIYDDLGRLIKEQKRDVDGTYDVRETQYDIAGRVTARSEWAAEGSGLAWTIYDYGLFDNPNAGEPGEVDTFVDPLGRIAMVIRPDGSITQTEYEGLSTRVTTYGIGGPSGPINATTTYLNDSFGRLIAVDSPGDGADAAYSYDELDNLTTVELIDPDPPEGQPGSQSRYFDYDALGRLRVAANPENGTVNYLAYDARGKLLQYKDAADNTFVNTYDEAGRLLSKQLDVGGAPLDLILNDYDGDDGFDAGSALGKLTRQQSFRIDNGVAVPVSTRTMYYGSISSANTCVSTNNIGEAAYAGLNGRLESVTTSIEPWGRDLRVDFCYNAMGLPYLSKYPNFSGSGRTASEVGRLYQNGILWEVHDLGRSIEYVTNVGYDAHGAVTQIVRGNQVADVITRDNQGRPTSFEVRKPYVGTGRDPLDCAGGGVCPSSRGPLPLLPPEVAWNTGTYAYDGTGNITQIGADAFAYDELTRLVGATIDLYGVSYQYDAFGNMQSRNKLIFGLPWEDQTYEVDPVTNRLVSQTASWETTYFQYDHNGNMTVDDDQIHVFDERNRLIEVWNDGLVASYDYDANGYRVRTVKDGIETYYVRGGSGSVLSEFRRAAGETVDAGWDKDYIYALGQAITLVKNEVPGQIAKPWASNVSDTQIGVRWHKLQDGDISRYEIRRWTEPSSIVRTLVVDDSASYVLDTFGGDFTVTSSTKVFYKIKAVDTAVNEGPESPSLVVDFDGQPPAIPTGLVAEGLDRAVRLTWDLGTEEDLRGYYVERKQGGPSIPWDLLTTLPFEGSEYHDFGLNNGGNYRYRIRAVDTAGNESANTATVTGRPRDEIPPGTPTGVRAQPGLAAGTVIVTWNPVSDYDLEYYMVLKSACGPWTGISAEPTETSAEFTGLTPGVECTFTVTASDTSSNYSEPSLPATAAPRYLEVDVPAPTLNAAAFEIEEFCDPPWEGDPPCPPPDGLDNSNVFSESNDNIGVLLEWTSVTGVDGYRVYRAEGTSAVFWPVATVDGETANSHFDLEINGHDYSYYVVAFKQVSPVDWESAAHTADPGDEPLRAIDAWDPTVAVRNAVASDGFDDFDTENARSRKITVKWSRVLESQLRGYHVYRKCQWTSCPITTYGSMDTFACENSWVRITASPVNSGRVLTDTTTGGLNGCFLYAVRPVGPDNEEGPMRKVVFVETKLNLSLPDDWYLHEYDTYTGWWPRTKTPMQDEIDSVNGVSKGTGPTEGAPPPPLGVSASRITVSVAQEGHRGWEGVQVVWSSFGQPGDLAGYHVEMAGSLAGPWRRLTKNPVAWWWTEYLVKGLGIGIPEGGYSGNVDCAHFRVIAVDEDGNESLPGYPSGYPLPGCGTLPTPPAPQNLAATTGSATPAYDCPTKLTWDEVPGAVEYYVYRANLYGGYYFYVTHYQAADDSDCLEDDPCCANGVCTYTERGDDFTDEEFATAETYCPYDDLDDDDCRTGFVLDAYYVTARGTTGGESPRSDIVFWDCNKSPGYASLEYCPTELEENVLFAGSTLGGESVLETDICPDEPVSLAMSASVAKASRPSIAPLLKLGQVPSGPPFKLIDIHVDHLGSTRLTTDDLGNVLTEHDFFPFGEELMPMLGESTKMFTGHERDRETGFDYMLARYYEPNMARFLMADPLTDLRSLSNSQAWNRYSYARNNPLAYVDPRGLTSYKTTLLGNEVTVQIDNDLSDEERQVAKEKVDAAVDEINNSEDELTDQEIETLGKISEIEVAASDKTGGSHLADVENNTVTLDFGQLKEASTAQNAGSIGHEASHIQSHQSGELPVLGGGISNPKVLLNRVRHQIKAYEFELGFGPKVGYTEKDVRYVESVLEDLRTLQNLKQHLGLENDP